MKLLAICCSPRHKETTYKATSHALDAAKEKFPQIDTEIIELAGKNILGCRSCGGCRDGLRCGIGDDFRDLIEVLADDQVKGMLIATPVYFGSMTGQAKCFLDRCVMFRRNGWLFRDRVGGVLSVGHSRNGGQELTLQAVHAAMMAQDMILVSEGKDTAHFGATLFSGVEGGIENDQVGLTMAANLGKRIAEVMVRFHGE